MTYIFDELSTPFKSIILIHATMLIFPLKPCSQSPGLQSRWRYGVVNGAHQDHTVVTPASTALNRDTPCLTGVPREVLPVVSIFFCKNNRDSPGRTRLRINAGLFRGITVALPA